jgi:hypothetical protein
MHRPESGRLRPGDANGRTHRGHVEAKQMPVAAAAPIPPAMQPKLLKNGRDRPRRTASGKPR